MHWVCVFSVRPPVSEPFVARALVLIVFDRLTRCQAQYKRRGGRAPYRLLEGDLSPHAICYGGDSSLAAFSALKRLGDNSAICHMAGWFHLLLSGSRLPRSTRPTAQDASTGVYTGAGPHAHRHTHPDIHTNR
ncbi:hypothetical protein BaRGS_00040487 [Batillaria attramentaria]|uniref:Uncharacterized protein n=1 Tax=Batillaria attramentaria TaxID=370345 RepID=A0ABD0IZY7_9CAEN